MSKALALEAPAGCQVLDEHNGHRRRAAAAARETRNDLPDCQGTSLGSKACDPGLKSRPAGQAPARQPAACHVAEWQVKRGRAY